MSKQRRVVLEATGRTKREAMVGVFALLYLEDPDGTRERFLAAGNSEEQLAGLLREAGIACDDGGSINRGS